MGDVAPEPCDVRVDVHQLLATERTIVLAKVATLGCIVGIRRGGCGVVGRTGAFNQRREGYNRRRRPYPPLGSLFGSGSYMVLGAI